MQKWEYLLVDANMYPFGNKLISLYVNGEEKRDWQQGVLHLFVNELGEEGWELVALRHDSKYDKNSLIFKRPKIVKKNRKKPDSDSQKNDICSHEFSSPVVKTATTQTKYTSVD